MLHDKDKYHNQAKGVKPKNRVYCPDSNRQKMKFNTKEEAQRFLKWNSDNFEEKTPSRIYWCEACCGYHITARPIGNVGVVLHMDLPYLTDALKTDRHRVMHAVKMIHKALYILKQPSGYFGKTGLGICKSILDNLNYSKNPYYMDERKEIAKVVDDLRAKYKDVWMKKKYCNLVKTKLYRILCDLKHDTDTDVKRYVSDLTYIHKLAEADGYDLTALPELFLDEWETLFQASPVSECLKDKMVINETLDNGIDKNTQNEKALDETKEPCPGIQECNKGEGL